MRIISFIYKKTVIKKILVHLGVYEEKKNQRAPLPAPPEYIMPIEIVHDDGWPGYDEQVLDF